MGRPSIIGGAGKAWSKSHLTWDWKGERLARQGVAGEGSWPSEITISKIHEVKRTWQVWGTDWRCVRLHCKWAKWIRTWEMLRAGSWAGLIMKDLRLCLVFVPVHGLLIPVASLSAEHRLSHSVACGVFLGQGSNWCPESWQADS